MVTAVQCRNHVWETVYEPYERVKCRECGEMPFATIPGAPRDFVVSDAMYPGFFGGRGSSKSVHGLVKLIRYAESHPYALMFATQPTNDGFEQNVLPALRKIWRDGEGTEWVFKEKKGQIVFPKLKVTVLLLSAEATIPGLGASFAAGWMDEIGVENQRDLFLDLQLAMRQDDFPHQIWVTSTPKVKFPWIKQIWSEHIHPLTLRPISDSAGRYPRFHFHTKDNPWLPGEIRETLLDEWEGTRYAAQELGGEFITVEGVAFPDFNRLTHVRNPNENITFAKKVASIDFGAASPTCITVIQQDQSQKLWITDSFYKRNATEYDWVRWCAERNITQLICDPSASDEQVMYWRRTYNIFMRRARSKRFDDRYKAWASRIAIKDDDTPGIYITSINEDGIAEMENLAFAGNRGRDTNADRWLPGSNDHFYDAAAYGLMEFGGGFGPPEAPFVLGRFVRR